MNIFKQITNKLDTMLVETKVDNIKVAIVNLENLNYDNRYGLAQDINALRRALDNLESTLVLQKAVNDSPASTEAQLNVGNQETLE